MNAFSVGSDDNNGNKRLVVLDMPGYGKGGRQEWGFQILKYLEKRKQLKRAFLLVDSEHGLKITDRQLIALFKEKNVPFQVILAKADKILSGTKNPGPQANERNLTKLQEIMENVKAEIELDTEEDGCAVGEIISTSTTKWVLGKRIGVEATRFAMLRAAGLHLIPKTKLGQPVEIVSHEDIFANHS